MELTWQQFRINIKNKTFVHEGKNVNGWNLPMNKQMKMYKELVNTRNTYSSFINSGAKNV